MVNYTGIFSYTASFPRKLVRSENKFSIDMGYMCQVAARFIIIIGQDLLIVGTVFVIYTRPCDYNYTCVLECC